MHIERLDLEVTRMCTLDCEHCFRGDSQNININIETINNIFTKVKKIDKLLITGGEPLIAVNQLEKMIELIKINNIEIKEINLVTNGTVLSSRVLNILKDLSQISKLNLSISFDIFHLIELEKKNLKQKRDENVKLLKEMFGAKEYGTEHTDKNKISDNMRQGLEPRGRAKYINKERLSEINSLVLVKYIVYPFVTWDKSTTEIKDGKLCGVTTVDVNGNIVGYGLSFEEEDMFAKEVDTNINRLSFVGAINSFIDNKELNKSEKNSMKK